MKKFFYMPLISMALTLSACGGESTDAAASSSQVTAPQDNAPVVRVALEPVYPPFVQKLPSGGFEGFDVGLMNEIAKRQGFTVNYIPSVWTGIFDRLANDEIDVIMGGVAITENRKEKVDFSNSYLSNNLVFVVKNDSPITNIEQLKGKRVAYQNDTVSANEWKKIQNGTLDESLGELSSWKTLQRVMVDDERQADAVISDAITTKYYVEQYPDQHLRIMPASNLPAEEIAFAVKKGNTELIEKLNKGLAEVKADGTFDKLKHEWLEKVHQHSSSESKEDHSDEH